MGVIMLLTSDLRLLIVMKDSIRYVNWVFSDSWVSMCIGINETEATRIRETSFCFWWLIQEQEHRMMMRWENEYLRIEGNRSSRSNHYQIGFHWMILEGYLYQSITKWILSRITEPIAQKLTPSPLKLVNEGRSIHSSFHSFSLRIVSVFL